MGAQGETIIQSSKKEGLTTVPSKVRANVSKTRVSCLTRVIHAVRKPQDPFQFKGNSHTRLLIAPPLQTEPWRFQEQMRSPSDRRSG